MPVKPPDPIDDEKVFNIMTLFEYLAMLSLAETDEGMRDLLNRAKVYLILKTDSMQ